MCRAHINVIFEGIKNRNPKFTSGFHTNVIAIILDKPVVEPLDIRVDGGKEFLVMLVQHCLNNSD